MGKIIVKNIKGMGWKAKISLIAMFTLAFSVLMYQGWQQLRNAQAAVAAGTAWTNIHASAPGNQSGTVTSAGTFTAGTGENRLLMVAVYCEIANATQAMSALSATYGGVAVTQIATTRATASREHIWIGYVKEASIPAGAQRVAVTYNTNSGANTLSALSVKVATYTGVDQANPVVGSNANRTATTSVATNAAVNYLAGGMTVFAAANGGTPVTQTITATPTLTTVAGATNATNHSTFAGAAAAHTGAGSYISGGVSITYSGTSPSNRSALAVASLNPAVTTLATGTDPAAAIIAPGAAVTDANTFTLQTSSAGTTEAISSITVNLSSNVGIGILAITDNANTVLGSTAAPVSGDNIITVTGLTATNTATTYKVRVTPLAHAAMPVVPGAANAVTAPVTAWVGNNIHAGSDTDTAALTIDNLSPANPTGFTGTPGANLVTLNWTNPGADFSQVVVLRSTAAVVATPVEGAAYSGGNVIGASTVLYVGPLTTFVDNTALNGTAYYYRIFAKDASGNYSQTGVAAGPYTPVSADSVRPTVDAGFAATTPVNSVTVPITSLSATDNVGGSGVAGYLITTTSVQPLASAAGWTPAAPTTFTAAGQGAYTLYPWTKDAAGNVSLVYGSPVAVVVDLTAPSVSAFTVTTPTKNRNIPLASFTAADTGGSGMAGYIVTTTSTPPAAAAAGWTPAAPTTYPVAADGSYTLYPWAKDAAGNVSALFGTPRTALVDATAPTGLAALAPADLATDLPTTVTLQAATATDTTSNPVTYWFQVENSSIGYSVNSGWQSGTSFAPAGLTEGNTYVWSVKAKDNLGNETAYTTPRTFTIQAPCVRNDPTLTLLTGSGGTAATITADGGTTVYELKVINNDFGSCGSSTFNLSTTDTDATGVFVLPSAIGVSSVTLAPGANTTIAVTVKAASGETTGFTRTTVTSAADMAAGHTAVETQFVQTTLNVIGCTANTPLLIIGPDSGYINKGGLFTYTVTIKNTDTGTGCADYTFTPSVLSDSGAPANFNTSSLSVPSLTLSAGELGSLSLTVSAKPAAAKGAQNITSIGVSAASHNPPSDISVTTTIGNPMLHNSDTVGSTKWAGKWGVPGGRYGEFICTTCHSPGGADTSNIKRIRQAIFTPFTTTHIHLPGEGKPIAFRRIAGTSKTQPVMGWDSGDTPRTTSSRICEVCHTYDATGANGSKVHPYAKTGTALGNHYNADGTDCTICHKHSEGFKPSGHLMPYPGVSHMAGLTPPDYGSCTGCHSTTAGGVFPAPVAGNAPNCTGCHTNAVSFNSANAGCVDCHGPSKTDGRPNGAAFPNTIGSHGVDGHVTTCATCHSGFGSGTSDHGSQNGIAHNTSAYTDIAFSSGVGAYDKAGTRTCSATSCHGNITSGAWGTVTANASCTKCHGKPTPIANYSSVRALQAAPGYGSGTIGSGAIGAHDAHLRAVNGYTTRAVLCSDCHTVPSSMTHSNALTQETWSNLAKNVGTSFAGRVTLTPTFTANTCSNIYCHGDGGVFLGTQGSDTTPLWTDSAYLPAYAKNATTCGKCHAALPVVPNQNHTTFDINNPTSCNLCHSHDGRGATHIDGTLQVTGNCNSCHDYDVTGAPVWDAASSRWSGGSWGMNPQSPEGFGAHAVHINYIKSRLGISTALVPTNQTYGAGNPRYVCGTCHTNDTAKHTADNTRNINFGDSGFAMAPGHASQQSLLYGASNPVYSGVVGVSSATTPKTCSNISCHYFTTPVWSAF